MRIERWSRDAAGGVRRVQRWGRETDRMMEKGWLAIRFSSTINGT